MDTKRFRAAEAIFWIITGAVICLLAWKFHLGSFQEPGPGFVAFFSGLFVSGVGLVMFFSESLLKSPSGGGPDFRRVFHNVSWSRLLYTMALLLGYALLLNTLGYILTTFLAMWGLFHDWKKNRWVTSLLTSLLTTAATYLVFEVWLHSQFPRGVFPWW